MTEWTTFPEGTRIQFGTGCPKCGWVNRHFLLARAITPGFYAGDPLVSRRLQCAEPDCGHEWEDSSWAEGPYMPIPA